MKKDAKMYATRWRITAKTLALRLAPLVVNDHSERCNCGACVMRRVKAARK